MQPGTVLLFHLFDRKDFLAKVRELDKFLLNFLQPFMPLAVSDLGLCFIPTSKPILFIQFLNVRDFCPKTPDLFAKNIKVIHSI